MTTNPTIPALKTSFLTTQISLLSTPLKPSSNPPNPVQDPSIPPKTITTVLEKTNTLVRQHNKRIFTPQATRHVAEQIDRLYWNAAASASEGHGEEWMRRGVDLSKEEVIEQLPPTWPDDEESEDAERYSALQARLVELDDRRSTAREKVESYKALGELVKGLGDVEGNVVVRGGEVERELERMRLLVLRVMRGVNGLEGRGGDGEEEGWEGDEDGGVEERVLGILEGV
ncbi:hypothetical protein GLAREA_03259 [Glarea lozoyensis ATCC 20868]|uniref:Kinetochore protein fta4 n=1 Tax=Glarea lozoyensis (strain ATCC 20868 / MF5171) TaxID=1116229 RepID=S3CQG2_GLAL2|nr:uncharacterized protein GLAREA_03259 [Glarea lozoyensis ATCC 20868]EPE27344.1 hypothetical protein GLAREA_03259 [Glarea lozoyensis ATCC 20868]